VSFDGRAAAPELERWIVGSALPRVAGSHDHDCWLNVRPLCLDRWLKQNEGVPDGYQIDESQRRRACQETV
jgi:hypothetical protein